MTRIRWRTLFDRQDPRRPPAASIFLGWLAVALVTIPAATLAAILILEGRASPCLEGMSKAFALPLVALFALWGKGAVLRQGGHRLDRAAANAFHLRAAAASATAVSLAVFAIAAPDCAIGLKLGLASSLVSGLVWSAAAVAGRRGMAA